MPSQAAQSNGKCGTLSSSKIAETGEQDSTLPKSNSSAVNVHGFVCLSGTYNGSEEHSASPGTSTNPRRAHPISNSTEADPLERVKSPLLLWYVVDPFPTFALCGYLIIRNFIACNFQHLLMVSISLRSW